MYLARFRIDQASFVASAADISAEITPLIPPLAESALLGSSDCGFAVRVSSTTDGKINRRLLINASEDRSAAVEKIVEESQLQPTSNLQVAQNENEYNSMTEAPGAQQIWIDHSGYSSKGKNFASDFRVLPLLSSLLSLAGKNHSSFTYQLNATYLPHDREIERQARKLIAGINLESSLPPLVRDMQKMLANRLTSSVYLIDELLGYDSLAALEEGQKLIDEHFNETTRKIGFLKPPLELGDFSDLFSSGVHSTKLFGPQPLIATAAAAMSPDDIRRLLNSRLIASTPTGKAEAKSLDAFISYSSSNFAEAARACEFLENKGLSCWIAPRDIRPGEPYPGAIIRALDAVRALVVLVSQASNISPHVHREIERALHRRAVIVPLRVEDMTPTGSMEYLLGMCHWLNAFNGGFDSALEQLYHRLIALGGK